MKIFKLFSLNSYGREVLEEWQMENCFSWVSSDPPQISCKAPLHQGRSPRPLLQVSPHWQWWWWHLPEMYFKHTLWGLHSDILSLPKDSLPLVIKMCSSHLGIRCPAWPVTPHVNPPCCNHFLGLVETGQCSQLLLFPASLLVKPGRNQTWESFLSGSHLYESLLRMSSLLHESIYVPDTWLFRLGRLFG